MSSSSAARVEAQWKAQLADMRAALAEIKLPPANADVLYESDVTFEEDDEFIPGNSGDDVWDFISDDDEEDFYSSDNANEETPPSASSGYGPQWLKSKCLMFASRKQGLRGEDLQEQIMALLASDSVEEELQSTLTDIVGFDDLDFVIDLISHRKEITAPSPFAVAQDDSIFGKLQTKRQREEALRQRDYEHKNATLGPSLDRDGPQYPHVYKSVNTGNLLDNRGRKYGLPVGSERKEHAVCIFPFESLQLILTTSRDMKSTAFQLQKLEHLVLVESLSISLRWMGFVGGHSRVTKLSIVCKVWYIQSPIKRAKICSFVLPLVL